MTGISSSRMEEDLESKEDADQHPSQTVTAFLVQSMQHAVLQYPNEKRRFVGLPFLAVQFIYLISFI